MHKVVVITRTKNRPVFLKRAIESVASQTYNDYIHLIVNDGGDADLVESIVSSFENDARKNIKIVHRETPSNAPDTIFNESIKRVKSDYIAVHDDDDSWHPQFLARTIELLDEGAQGVVVRTDKVIEEVASNNDRIRRRKVVQYLPHVKAINLYRQCAENQLTPVSFIYSRAAYESIGGYDDSLPVVGDWEFGIRFLQRYDVEYLDPGFALANYHHRNKRTQSHSDSSFARHDHRYYFNLVSNRYLRQDLAEGRLGVGYIINDIRYNQAYIARLLSKVLPQNILARLKRRASE